MGSGVCVFPNLITHKIVIMINGSIAVNVVGVMQHKMDKWEHRRECGRRDAT